jgi:nucleotide-binding universal stress UspA family protein
VASEPVLIVGIDGSEASLRALRFAARAAQLAAASLRIVYVSRTPPAVHTAPVEVAGAAAVADQVAADHAHLNCELVLAAEPIVWSFEQRNGAPADELDRAAADVDAMAIVVGRRACRRSRLALRPESIVDRLLRTARRPVVVVPSVIDR